MPSLIVDNCEVSEKSPPTPPQEGGAHEGTKGMDAILRWFKANAKKRVVGYWGHGWGGFSCHLTTANSERIELGRWDGVLAT
jgi:hypothetical protein